MDNLSLGLQDACERCPGFAVVGIGFGPTFCSERPRAPRTG